MRVWLVLLSSIALLGCLSNAKAGSSRPAPEVASSAGLRPADPDLIPEARRVLGYLRSIQGKKMLSGISGSQDAQPWAVLHVTGREPAIAGGDMAGFHRKWEKLYHEAMRYTVDHAIRWWRQKGGIVALQYHWMKPGNPEGNYLVDPPSGTGPLDLAKAVTPGTEEHRAVMADLKVTADYLQQLAEARVPVLWRPLHEIDGGWFWWTDRQTPENTAALWRLMFDYFVKERKLHNLIWVYNAAHISHTRKSPNLSLEEEVAHRKRYYPGPEYVDIASIDTYPNPDLGWGEAQADGRRRAYELMQKIAPGKMLAIAEDGQLVNPEAVRKERVPWLYCSAWWAGARANPVDWMRKTFNHEYYLTLDELPLLIQGNVMPNVRITQPADGAALTGTSVTLSGVATDRNRNLRRVRLHALRGFWRNWTLRSDAAVLELFRKEPLLGEARLRPDGSWTFTWNNPQAGFYNVVALAEDAEGLVGYSNIIRVTVGLQNLARGAIATASSTSAWGDPLAAAIDGDPHTMWWSDNERPDPQWLMLDMGAERSIGGVSVLWWKAYATDYTVEVSHDAQNWREVARVTGRGRYEGDMDILRFEPVKARYVRLHCTKRSVTWQAYTVFEFGVWEDSPAIRLVPSERQ